MLLKILEESVCVDTCLKAAYELGRLEHNAGIQKLNEALDHQDSPIIRRAVTALKLLNSETSGSVLLEALQHPNRYVRKLAVQALGEIGHDTSIPHLLEVLKYKDSHIRGSIDLGESAVNALEQIGGEKSISALISVADHPNLSVRIKILQLLGNSACKLA